MHGSLRGAAFIATLRTTGRGVFGTAPRGRATVGFVWKSAPARGLTESVCGESVRKSGFETALAYSTSAAVKKMFRPPQVTK